jgi:hypothetical protein
MGTGKHRKYNGIINALVAAKEILPILSLSLSPSLSPTPSLGLSNSSCPFVLKYFIFVNVSLLHVLRSIVTIY